jgi:hypothetical protein
VKAANLALKFALELAALAAFAYWERPFTGRPSREITLKLGRGETPLPEPLAQVAQALRDQELQRTGIDGWLIPGRHAGQHITADRLQQRLKRYGIKRSREGRHAALLALAARLPAPTSRSGSGSTNPARPGGSAWPAAPTPTTWRSASQRESRESLELSG